MAEQNLQKKRRRTDTIGNAGFNQTAIAIPEYKPVYNVEWRNYNIGMTSTEISSTGGAINLFGPVLGDDIGGRNGRRCIMKKLVLRFRLIQNAAEDSTVSVVMEPTIARIVIVYDKQANAASPPITEVLTSAEPSSLYNVNNQWRRFTFLYDKTFNFGGYSADATRPVNICPPSIHSKEVVRNLNLEAVFDAAGGAIPRSGSLYAMVVGLGASSSQEAIHMEYTSRVFFEDS